MNKIILILIYLGIMTVLVIGCKEDEDKKDIPVEITGLITTPVSNLSVSSLTVGAILTTNPDGFVIRKGVCWDTIPNPTIDDPHVDDVKKESGEYVLNLTGLHPGTKYFLRSFAISSIDTAYGNELTFNTKIQDHQGHTYNTVTLGNQVWMAENLRVTRYRNGDSIATTSSDFYSESEPKYQWVQQNNEAYAETYGRLYTWFAAVDQRCVCPAGWHVPTQAEWEILKGHLGGEDLAGGKMKVADTTYWKPPNTGATNESGFNALGSGYVTNHGQFVSLGITSYFWSSESGTYNDNTWGMGQGLYYNRSVLLWGGYYPNTGKSVRCVRDY